MTSPSPALISQDSEVISKKKARTLIIGITSVVRTLNLYPLQNMAVQRALDESYVAFQELMERDGEVQCYFYKGLIRVNVNNIQSDLETYASIQVLTKTMEDLYVGKLSWTASMTREAWQRWWTYVVEILRYSGSPEQRFDLLDHFTQGQNFTGLEIVQADQVKEQGEGAAQNAEVAKQTYIASVIAFKKVMSEVRLGKNKGRRELKRAIQGLVDQIVQGETALLGMTTLRDHDEYTFTHSVNVAVFSIAIGKRLGLSHKQLFDLGMAALFHDIGKSRLPIEILQSNEELTDKDWQLVKEHPWQGVLALFNIWPTDSLPWHAAIAAYEHHMKLDQTGYPSVHFPRTISLYSKIVAVADGFDAATSKRVYQEHPAEPSNVLAGMLQNPNRGADPIVVKAFIHTLGIYPVGTLVVLDTYEMAIVEAPNPNTDHLSRPLVKLITDPMGNFLHPAVSANLAVQDDAGNFLRTIIQTVEPEQYNVRVSDYLT